MLWLFRRLMDEQGGDGGAGGNGDGAPKGKDPAGGKQTFSSEYVHELREENKTWRQRYQTAEQEKATLKKTAEDAATAADNKVKEASLSADQRVIRAELKAAATKAGMVDLDGLKLADLSKVKLDANTGEVIGADEMLKALKDSKPYLFGATKTSNTNDGLPAGDKSGAKKATEMTQAEYAAARKQFS